MFHGHLQGSGQTNTAVVQPSGYFWCFFCANLRDFRPHTPAVHLFLYRGCFARRGTLRTSQNSGCTQACVRELYIVFRLNPLFHATAAVLSWSWSTLLVVDCRRSAACVRRRTVGNSALPGSRTSCASKTSATEPVTPAGVARTVIRGQVSSL